MFGYDYQDKWLRELTFNHSKDFGRLCGDIMLYSPKLVSDFQMGILEAMLDYAKGIGPAKGFRKPEN